MAIVIDTAKNLKSSLLAECDVNHLLTMHCDDLRLFHPSRGYA